MAQSLAGIIGKEPATVDPLFLDSLRDKPDQTFPVTLKVNGAEYGVYDFTSLESFLTNRPTRFQLTDTAGFEPGRIWRSSYIGWFVQDQYRATDRISRKKRGARRKSCRSR